MLWIALAVLVALVFLNDIGRWVNGQSQLNENASVLSQWATDNVRGGSVAANGQKVIAEGAKHGLTVYRYDQDENSLRIWGSAEVPGTWVIGPYVAVLNGTPLDRALGVPFVVRTYQEARRQ
jgi:hypothetical protein